jgi:hypothetical protein
MIKQWFSYVLAYLLWTLNLIIGIWFIMISRNFLLGFLGISYVGENIVRGWQIGFLDKVYLIALGLAWLIFIIVMEDDLRKSVKKGTLMRRFTRFAGPEFLLVFLADLGLLILQGPNAAIWLRWLMLLIELGLAAVCIQYTRSQRKDQPDKMELSHPH